MLHSSAMLAKRLPVLLAFAAGSLGTALVGFSRSEPDAAAPPQARRAVEPSFAQSDRPVAATKGDPDHAVPDVAERIEPMPSDVETAPDAGSSMAEVLMALEASYRKALAEPEAEPPPPVADTPLAAPPAAASIAATSPGAGSIAPAPLPSAAPPSRLEAPAAAAPPVTSHTLHVAQAQSAPQPSNVHVGDLHQNIYLGNVHQGDLLQVQQLQLQQLAILEYLQLLALSSQRPSSSSGRAHAPGSAPTRRPRPFSMALTNPDNPWGFDFPPTVLVK